MIQDLATQVLGVTSRASRDGTKTMYDVALADGNTYTTFNVQLAQKAQGLQGQPVTARVEQKPNQRGGAPYLNINDIGPQGTLPALVIQQPQPGFQPALAQAQIQPGFQPQAAPQFAPSPAPAQDTFRRSKEEMRRTEAASIAFGFVGQFYTSAGPEMIEEAAKKAAEIANRISKFIGAEPVQQAAQQPTTPQQVAAQVPGVQVGVQPPAPEVAPPDEPPSSQSDDIPW